MGNRAQAPAAGILRAINGQNALMSRHEIRNNLENPEVQRTIQAIQSKVAIMAELDKLEQIAKNVGKHNNRK